MAQTLEAMCRKARYRLWYERRTVEIENVTHNYWNGKLKLGKEKKVGEWVARLDTTVLMRSLMLKWLHTRSGEIACPVGTGKTQREARADLIKKIAGHRIYFMLASGGTEWTDVPMDLK